MSRKNQPRLRILRFRSFLVACLIAFALVLLFSTQFAGAATTTLNPNASGSASQWNWVGGATNYTCWQSDDADTTYAAETARNQNQIVNLDDSALSGSINSVTVYAKARQTTGDEFIQLILRTNATNYFSLSTGVIPTTFADFSNTWMTNPNTGVAWAWAEINALEAGVRSIRNGGTFTGELRVTRLWVEVDYTPPDTTPPTTTLTTVPSSPDGNGVWFKTIPQITLTPDGLATTYYQWDSTAGDWTVYAGNFTAPSGMHTLYYYSVDDSSNSETVKSQLFSVDNSAPSSSITSPTEGQLLSGASFAVSGSASDTPSGIAQVEVSIDASPWQLATGTSPWFYNWTLPADGTYNLKSRATDTAGNVETPGAGVNVTVDNTAPTLTGTNPANGATGVTIASDVTATFSEDMDSSTITTSTFTLSGGKMGLVSWNASTNTATFNPDSDLDYATAYTATITTGAKDPAGNGLSADYVFSFTTADAPDTIAPTTTLSTAPPAPDGSAGWFKTVPSITLTSNESGTTYYSWVSATGPFTTYSGAFSAPSGQTTLYYYSVDSSSNTETVKSQLFSVDGTAPSSAITSPTSGQLLGGTSFNVTGTASDATSGVAQVEVSIDSGPWQLATGTGPWSYNWVFGPSGTHTLNSRATDAAGNTSAPSAPVTVNVDTGPPSVISTTPTDGATGVAVDSNVTVTFSENMDPSTINTGTFHMFGLPGVVTYDSLTQTATFNPDSNLGYSLSYIAQVTTGAEDLAGNALSANYTFMFSTAAAPDTTPPVTSLSTVPSSPDGTAPWFKSVPSITLTPDESATTYYSWISATGPFTTYSGAFSAPSGTNTLYYYSVDGSSNSETVKSQAFSVDTGAPASSITSPTSGQLLGGTSFNVTGTASDATSGVAQVEVSIDSGPWQLATGTGPWSYNWVFGPSGTHTLNSRATDAAGNTSAPSAPVTVNVDTGPPSVISTTPTDGAFGVAVDSNVTVTFSENMDSSTINTGTFHMFGLPGVVTYDSLTQTATFNPDSNLGYSLSYIAQVTTGVRDLAGNALSSNYVFSFTTAAAPDTTPPTTTLTTIPSSPDGNNDWFITAPSIILTPDEPATTYYSWVSPTGPWTTFVDAIIGLEGEPVLHYYSEDLSGLVEFTKSYPLKVDTAPPSSGFEDYVAVTGVIAPISGTATDTPSSGVATVEISVDGGPWQPTTFVDPNWTYNWVLPADGTYNLKSRATDNAGNVETPGPGIDVIVDNTAPTVTGTSPTNGATGVAIGSNVTATFSEDMDSSTINSGTVFIGGKVGLITWNASTKTATVNPDTDLDYSTTYTATVTTGAKDQAGNSLAANYVFSFTTADAPDTTPPTTSLTTNPSAPDGNNDWFKTAPSITLTPDEPATTYYSWNSPGPPWTTYSVPFDAPEEETDLYYYSVDLASNTEPVRIKGFKVDITPPLSDLTTPDGGWEHVSGGELMIETNAVDSPSSGVAAVEISIDGGPWQPATFAGPSWTYNWILPADGTYNLRSRATDNAGNVETPGAGVNATVDNTAPAVTTTSPANGQTGVAIGSNVTAAFSEDMDAATINTSTFTLSGGVSGVVSYNAGSQTATFNPDTSLGYSTAYTATVTTGAKDLSGQGLASERTWTFTTEAPSNNTPSGTNVEVTPTSGVGVTFNQVTGAGNTTVANVSAPAAPPTGYAFSGSVRDIVTTAAYSGPITVTLSYGTFSGNESDLKLFHWNGSAWEDCTTSTDMANNRITGQVTSLSPFAVGYAGTSVVGYSFSWFVATLLALTLAGIWLLRKKSSAVE